MRSDGLREHLFGSPTQDGNTVARLLAKTQRKPTEQAMAATERFEEYVGGLTAREREALQGVLAHCRAELLAARSEEARVRIVEEFVQDIRDRLVPQR